MDEDIVLNKYYSYLKKYGSEYDEFIKTKIKSILSPIKEKEKEIESMKKNIHFYKNISNQMLLQYMIDKQQQLKGYIEEIYSSRYKNSENSEKSESNHNLNYNNYNYNQMNQEKNILTYFRY